MSAPTIQPGTQRCDCDNYRCEAGSHGRDRDVPNVERCRADAVRMVTVRLGVPGNYPLQKDIPMCEPCAAHAEAKAGQP